MDIYEQMRQTQINATQNPFIGLLGLGLPNPMNRPKQSNKEITFEFEAGALIRGNIRRNLENMKFRGDITDYIEQKGLFESDFSVKGKRCILIDFSEWLNNIYGKE